MAVNYERPAFTGSNFKPPRGTWKLEQEKAKAKVAKDDKAVKDEVKAMDGCRWPERHRCRGQLEAAHIHDESTGGDMVAENLIGMCAWLHRRGPESIHGGQLDVRPRTAKGTRGPCKFYRKKWSETRKGEFTWRLVATEIAPGQLETK